MGGGVLEGQESWWGKREGARKGGDEREMGQLAPSDRRGRGVEGVACASSSLWDTRGREGGRDRFFLVERGQQMDSSKQ